jgi:hydrogenase nickel incorporation protein HypA/HybF
MHELIATQGILEKALQHAQAAGARRITDLYLVVGELSDMVDEPIQFYWDSISAGTPAEGARLHFRRVPAELLCTNCNRQYAPVGEETVCPACGDANYRLVAGGEFYLEAIDVEPAQT